MAKRSGFFRPLISGLRAVLEWIGKYELSVMLALLLFVAAIWGFVEIADAVAAGRTMKFDEWAIRAMRKPNDPAAPIGPRWLAEVGRDLTALGGVAFLTLLTIAVAGFLWIKRMYGAMLLVLVATLGGLTVSMFLKMSFDRPRPDFVPHLSHIYTSSFPSGHAMLSATVFLTLGALLGRFVQERVLKAYFLIIALLLSVLVGVSRVYMGVHYPTDVLTGWSAGLAWAILCWLVARFMQRKHMVESTVND
jgi:undecaprenyl-diphosphatase